jgi:cytochrome c oxidase subunit 3
VKAVPTTLTTPKEKEPQSGHGGGGNLDDLKFYGGGGDDAPGPERMPPPEGYRLTIRLILVSVSILFLALTIVYLIINAQAQPIQMPRVLWFSTAVVMACSLAVERARRALWRRNEVGFKRWLWTTMALGLVFLSSQYVALQLLKTSGFYAAINTLNKRAWLAFLITMLHGAHLLGGLVAQSYVIVKSQYGDWTALRRRITMDGAALYWHFIDGVWIFLFALVFLWK